MQKIVDQKIEIDPLTGFYSREGLLRSAEMELNKVEELTHPVTLLYLDLHDYPKFVKEHGEPAGNSLLLFVGDCIRKNINKTALTGRLHADEFVILLPGAGPERALHLLRRLRRALQGELQKSNFDVKAYMGGITYLTSPASMETTLQNLEKTLHDLKKSRKINTTPNRASTGAQNES